MSAGEVIEQIRSLAPEERAEVMRGLLEIESEQGAASLDDRSFDEVAEQVLQRHSELFQKLAE